MGFHDMVLFNQAMLGMQWRLLTDPTSLCARVLKGRYFPHTDFWNASCPRSASYTWRSIMFGMKLVWKGVRWGVGDGSQIRIMSDNWIPGIAPFMLRPLVPLSGGHTVDLLLAEDARSWDEPTVRSVFVKELADTVLQILISRFDGEDFVSWPHTKLGVFSVRSAYNLARLDQAQVSRSTKGRGMTSDSISESKFWKALWAIQALGKMHITLWRFAHDCLSSGAQLCLRQVPASSACIHCSAED